MTICFSGNVPIEITISEVYIDHSKADRIFFSLDNINRKGDGRTIKTEQFNQQEIDAKSAILLGCHFQSFRPMSPSNTRQLTDRMSNTILSRTTCITDSSLEIRHGINCFRGRRRSQNHLSPFSRRICLLVVR